MPLMQVQLDWETGLILHGKECLIIRTLCRMLVCLGRELCSRCAGARGIHASTTLLQTQDFLQLVGDFSLPFGQDALMCLYSQPHL